MYACTSTSNAHRTGKKDGGTEKRGGKRERGEEEKEDREKSRWLGRDQKISREIGRVRKEFGKFRRVSGKRSGDCRTWPNLSALLPPLQGSPSKGDFPKSFGEASWTCSVADSHRAPKFPRPMSRFFERTSWPWASNFLEGV